MSPAESVRPDGRSEASLAFGRDLFIDKPMTRTRFGLRKLTGHQWSEIGERYMAGETATSLSLEFGVTAAGIRNRFSRSPR